MKFDRPETVSFKSFDDGEYVGVIVGFSYIGTHATKEWGDKPKIMIRWEVHQLDSPHRLLVDDEDLTHVVTQSFPATIRGEQSWLYKALVAHGIVVPGGGVTDSKEWYGKVAMLTVEGAQGTRGDRVFMNVTDIQDLDHSVDIKPTLKFEHWEPDDTNPPPMWARAMIDKSIDIYQRANQVKGVTPAVRPGSGPTAGASQPSRPNQGTYQPPAQGGYRPVDGDDDDDIPF